MRGAPLRAGGGRRKQGIIPADAGSTTPPSTTRTPNRDHPRGCGEHLIEGHHSVVKLGSSPRMRGAHPYAHHQHATAWIIPADAGSTCRRYGAWVPSQDHPRGCGEHGWSPKPPRPVGGSSPRMRGAPKPLPIPAMAPRIIPADAGSTYKSMSSSIVSWDHPRGCGEHRQDTGSLCTGEGSSPRMRGAPHVHGLVFDSGGIIPADAGSTLRNPCNPNNTID